MSIIQHRKQRASFCVSYTLLGPLDNHSCKQYFPRRYFFYRHFVNKNPLTTHCRPFKPQTSASTVHISSKLLIAARAIFPFSALTLLVGRQEGHPACKKKNWMLVCWWWWYDWSFARLIAPVVTTTSIILCFNKQRLRLTQVHLENGR